MFVGFIAVVVILLVVVGLMSTGATNGSGGVDQTKATKAISEISALAQSSGFYKTTTTNSDYTGLTVAALQAAGIVDEADLVDVTTITNLDAEGTTAVPTTGNVIKSKAVPGVYYNIVTNTTTPAAFDVQILVDTDDVGATSTLAAALSSNYNKLATAGAVAGESGFVVNAGVDGNSIITFR